VVINLIYLLVLSLHVFTNILLGY